MSIPSHPRSHHSGFTLVEVAIALAIFVFGALAIVQIFPPALGVIRNNESRVIATQMSESTLARMNSRTSPAPEAIYDVDASGNWQDFPGAVVGSATRNNSLPTSPIDAAVANSALGHFRYIYGEPHRIGPGQTIQLTHPVDNTTISPTATHDEAVLGVRISRDGFLDFSNAYRASSPNSGFYEADNPTRETPPEEFRWEDGVIYYVSYRWQDSVTPPPSQTYSQVRGVLEEPLRIYEADTRARVFACAANTDSIAVPGGVSVRMRRNVSLTSGSQGNPGSGIVSITNSGTSSGTFRFNYLASDWRTLLDESAPSPTDSATVGQVTLPVGGLDEGFNSFGLLTRSDKRMAPTPLTVADIDRRTGRIQYNMPTWEAPRIYTIYRALDGWAHQPTVAPRSYIPFHTNRNSPDAATTRYPREPWREYFWDGGSNLYFHPGEAGKTISVSFHSASGTYITGAVITIPGSLEPAPAAVPAGFFGAGNTATPLVARAELTNLTGNPESASSIVSVKGLTVSIRTAWLNNDRYNQVIVPGYRTVTP